VDEGDVNVEEFRPIYVGIAVQYGEALAYVRSCIKK
jgi:hypothetical protein